MASDPFVVADTSCKLLQGLHDWLVQAVASCCEDCTIGSAAAHAACARRGPGARAPSGSASPCCRPAARAASGSPRRSA